MLEDIVTRLKQWDDQQPPFAIMLEAAEEIESLRKELDVIGEIIASIFKHLEFPIDNAEH